MGDDWRVRIALVDLPRELTDDDQVYARGYPASPHVADESVTKPLVGVENAALASSQGHERPRRAA